MLAVRVERDGLTRIFSTRRWRMTGGSYSGVLTVAGASIAPRWRRSDSQ